VPCFSEAKASRDHDPATHAFRVIEQHSIPIYTKDWGADEELLLLEGAETYGLGSWAEIADHIGGCRTREEVREHYVNTYIESSNFPLPEHASPDDRALIDEIPREEFQVSKKRRIEQRKDAAKNATQGPPKTKPTASVPSCHEVAGYMPGRLEFETEYFNEAEEAVQHMQFEPGESLTPDPEVDLKMTIMNIYNGRLRARVERKKIIFEHQLLEYKKNQAADKKRSKEEKELLNRAKPFARMMNHGDFVAFCEDLEYEQNLRLAIAQLQDWRHNKIMDLRSGERYELEKQQRAQRGSQFSSLDRLTAKALGKASLASEGPTLAATFVSPELVLTPYGGLTPPPSDTEGHRMNGLTNGVNGEHKQRVKFVMQPLPNCVPLSYEEPPDDLHLLTDEEKEVCRLLRLYPKPYIVLKENVIREVIKLGGAMKKKNFREIVRIDAIKAARLYDFFVHCGWLAKA
jgi:transcriptional adapter 2-alpha